MNSDHNGNGKRLVSAWASSPTKFVSKIIAEQKAAGNKAAVKLIVNNITRRFIQFSFSQILVGAE